MLDEEEESFPRGGQETLTPLEKRVIRERAKEDLLFSEVCMCVDGLVGRTETINLVTVRI